MQTESGKIDVAVQQLARMEGYLAQDTENSLLIADIIELCLQSGQFDAARRHVTAARALFPDDAFFQQREGHVLIAEGEFALALEIFECLYRLKGDAVLGHDLAYAQFCLGQYAQAQMTLQAHLSQPDVSAVNVALMLRCQHHLGQLSDALELASIHEKRCADDRDFLSAVSLLYLDDGQLERAQQASAAAIGGDVSGGGVPLEAMVVGATLALAQGNLGTADRYYQAALKRKPDDGRSWSGIGLASLLRHDLESAAKQLEQALVYLPQHIGTRHLLGWCKIMAHDLVAADAIFRAALALDRTFGETHGGLAVVAALCGKRVEAEEGIRRALGLNPDGLAARYAQMLLSGGATDPEMLKRDTQALLKQRAGLFGGSMADMLAKFTH
jgi:tetratricopeptide (TPR) repeat protein